MNYNDDEQFRLGVQQRLYNWHMRYRRKELGLSQSALGSQIGLGAQSIGRIETLRLYPSFDQQTKISDRLELPIEYLFPLWLAEFRIVTATSPEEDLSLSYNEMKALGVLNIPALIAPDMDEAIDANIAKEALQEALMTLNYCQRKIIDYRFALTDGTYHTLEESAKEFRVTRERIRQIERRALSKLRDPAVRSKLQAACEVVP